MINAIVGGTLIGIAAGWLMLSLGRVAGISGILTSALSRTGWAVMFIAGLGVGGWLGAIVIGADIARAMPSNIGYLVAGGLLVGFGTRLGSGCTSGHGVCGVARLSTRSIVATVTFLVTGVLTATLVHAP